MPITVHPMFAFWLTDTSIKQPVTKYSVTLVLPSINLFVTDRGAPLATHWTEGKCIPHDLYCSMILIAIRFHPSDYSAKTKRHSSKLIQIHAFYPSCPRTRSSEEDKAEVRMSVVLKHMLFSKKGLIRRPLALHLFRCPNPVPTPIERTRIMMMVITVRRKTQLPISF